MGTHILRINYLSHILEKFNIQRANHLFCDVNLIVDGELFKLHRSVLAANSDYFWKLFSSIKDQNTFVLPGVPLVGFQTLLDYMYTAKWSLNRLNIDDVYTASLILGFEHMKAACEKVYQELKLTEKRNFKTNPLKDKTCFAVNNEEESDSLSSANEDDSTRIDLSLQSNSSEELKEICFKDEQLSSFKQNKKNGRKRKTDDKETEIERKKQRENYSKMLDGPCIMLADEALDLSTKVLQEEKNLSESTLTVDNHHKIHKNESLFIIKYSEANEKQSVVNKSPTRKESSSESTNGFDDCGSVKNLTNKNKRRVYKIRKVTSI